MPRYTRGQAQILEMMAVVLVFSVLLIFGLYWFSSFSADKDFQEQDFLSRQDLLEQAEVVMHMTELQCSIAGRAEANCVDLYKVIALNDSMDNDPDLEGIYRDRFYGYQLWIDVIYPPPVAEGLETRYTIFDFEPPGYIKELGSEYEVAIPVVLYNPVTERKIFSMLRMKQKVMK